MRYTNKSQNGFTNACLSESWYDAQDVLGSIRDVQLEEITADVARLIRKHERSCSNEIRDIIAFDAFCDACEAWDIPGAADLFIAAFPQCEGATL